MTWVTLCQRPPLIPTRSASTSAVASLRRVAPKGLLDVRECRAILHVQERAALWVPCDNIGAPRELVVLIRLVHRDPKTVRSKAARLELAHRRVNEVLVGATCALPLARV